MLYQWLIEPVETYLPAANTNTPALLGIIPHDTLHYLPFGLLHAASTEPSLPLLLDNYNLFSAPSAASLAYVLARRKPVDNSLLALANPSAPGAPFLAYAEREAQTVAALYQTEAQIGVEAGEGAFKQQAGHFGIVHIAAHSDLSSESPLFSAILLSEGGSDDGRLETHEIFNLDLTQTHLVVLSACETHLGQLSRGDEIVGIERAFLRAGAPSLLSTLWPVDDIATAYFMQSFYTHLRQDQPKAAALRLAQQETREAFPEPYFWAGVILVGAPQ
jgi:CHAT domain-containing protein